MSASAAEQERLQRALAACYRQLNRRERTVRDMRTHLARQGFDEQTVQTAIDVLLEDRHLDDARYVRMMIEDKRSLEDWGAERIRRTLLERGIDAELVDEAVRDDEPEHERERALALLERRFPAPPATARERERALGVLLRKGFARETALEALRRHSRPED